jgi:hypothetical protein
MATKSAHILLETNRMAAFLKMVRRGDVSNLARIDPNVSPWGGAAALARETTRTIFKTINYDRVLKVVCRGKDSSASTLGRGDSELETPPAPPSRRKGDLSCESQPFLSHS